MSLKGSLHTVALPEVLEFLASTGKTGELTVKGDETGGHLWFDGGELSGFEAANSPDAIEAVFQLLRIDSGEFDFTAGAQPGPEAHQVEPVRGRVDEVLASAQTRLAEWTEIVAVVPSLQHRVTLVADHPSDRVEMERDLWSLVVAVGDGRTVEDVLVSRGLGEFEGCRRVRDLVSASLAEIGEPELHTETEPPTAEQSPAADPVQEAVEPAAADAEVGFDHVEDHVTESVEEPVLSEVPAPAEGVAAGAEQAPIPVSMYEAPFGLAPTDHFDGAFEAAADPSPAEAFGLFGDAQPDAESLGEIPVQANGWDEMDGADASEAALETVPAAAEWEAGAEAALVDPDGGPTSGRAALQALIDQVAAEPLEAEGADENGVDGLADRGPWTSNELASFDGWRAEETSALVEPDQAAVLAEEEPDEAPAEEPINRGLLLKFLSSVRN